MVGSYLRQYDYNSRPEDRVNEVNRNLYEEENNRRVAALSEQVSLLKEVSQQIAVVPKKSFAIREAVQHHQRYQAPLSI